VKHKRRSKKKQVHPPPPAPEEQALVTSLLQDFRSTDPAKIAALVPDSRHAQILIDNLPLEDEAAIPLLMAMKEAFKDKQVNQVAGIESRGFILSPILAYQLGVGFVPVRKKGKLPAAKEAVTYTLEYGEDSLEVHRDAIEKGTRVLIVDDLLATGGTAQATVKLVEKLGGIVVGLAFIIELSFLNGREKLQNYPIHSLITY